MVASREFHRWRIGSVADKSKQKEKVAGQEPEEEKVREGLAESPTEEAPPDEQVAPPEEPAAALVALEEEPVDEITTLREELETVKAKEAEYLDGWQRARAELANARKRFQREQEQAYANARADVLARLLPIVDDFERAFATLPDNLSSLTWIEGMKLVQHKFLVLLEQEGVMPIETADQEFDPFLHQAVTHEPSDDVPDGHVIAELQRGYKVGERVLRPSVVRVSSGPPPPPEAEPEAEAEPAEEGEAVQVEQS
jgi:molecular chaperone GrpE